MKEDVSLFLLIHHGLCKAIEHDGVICFGKIVSKSLCTKHYSRLKKYGCVNLPKKEIKRCKFIDCNKEYKRGGYCNNHYSNKWAYKRRSSNDSELPKCLVDDCNKRNYVRGYCNRHYLKLMRFGDVNYKQKRANGKNHPNVLGRGKHKKCIVPECNATNEIPNSIIKGLCHKHYGRWRKYKSYNLPEKPKLRCTAKNCNNEYFSKGFCRIHYGRWKTHGDYNIVLQKGRKHGSHSKQLDKKRQTSQG